MILACVTDAVTCMKLICSAYGDGHSSYSHAVIEFQVSLCLGVVPLIFLLAFSCNSAIHQRVQCGKTYQLPERHSRVAT